MGGGSSRTLKKKKTSVGLFSTFRHPLDAITSYQGHPPANSGALHNIAPPNALNPQVQALPAQSYGQAPAPHTHSRGATPSSNACPPNPSEGARPGGHYQGQYSEPTTRTDDKAWGKD